MSSEKDKLPERRMIWYVSGQLWAREFYLNGKFEGERKTWYKNGMLESCQFYRADKLEGKCEEWYDDGYPLVQVFLRDHKMEGEYKRLLEDGHIRTYQFCRNDKKIDENFTPNKKLTFLRIKQSLRNRTAYLLDTMLILDLAQYAILPPK
jgi:antitoxin component YwqK of YwqJK toxin-antitoxin module